MYNDTTMTITGNIVDEPRKRTTRNGHAVTNLRIASTSRRKDRDTGQWVDNATLFVTVTCWRALAENVEDSMHKGDPVIVTGRFYSREYEVGESKRSAYELEANAIGHDLARGTAAFRRRTYRPEGVAQMPVDENGVPVDESDHWLDLSTGEVFESEDAADGASEAGAARAADSASDRSAQDLVAAGAAVAPADLAGPLIPRG